MLNIVFVLLQIVLAGPLPTTTQALLLKVGCCASLKEMESVQPAGFDYYEIRVSEVEALSDDDFQKLRARLNELKLPTPVANYFLPGRIKVTGPSVDAGQQQLYLRKALDRMALLGVKVIVFGSSGARNIPAGFAREEALRQLTEFCRGAAAEAGNRDISIVIEPLRPQESNIINTAAEGLSLVEAVGHPRLQLLVDFYHMASQNEEFSIIGKASPRILHAHIANPAGRVYPKPGDGCDYAAFFAALRGIGYRGSVSVEANTSDMRSDGPQAISLIRAGMK